MNANAHALRRSIAAGAVAAAGLSCLAGLAASSCSKQAEPSSGDTFPINMTVSLTGTNDGIGPVLRDGTKTAEMTVNAIGGVLGRRLDIKITDDQSQDGVTLKPTFDQFLSQQPVVLLGPTSSGEVVGVAPSVGAAHVLQLVSWATSTALPEAQPPTDRWLFRTCPSDRWQFLAFFKAMTNPPPPFTGDGGAPTPGPAPDAGDAAASAPGHSRTCLHPAIVYGDDTIGNPYHERLRDLFRVLLNISFVAEEKVGTSQTSQFDAVIADIKSKSPPVDCIALPLYPDTAIGFLRELAVQRAGSPQDFAPNLFAVGADGLHDDKVLQEPSAQDFLIGTVPDTNPVTPEADEFRNLYNEYTGNPSGTPPPNYAATAFDSVILLSLAIEKSKTLTDSRAIRDALVTISRGGTINATPISPAELATGFEDIRADIDINYQGASGSVDMDGDPDAGTWTGDIVGGNYEVWAVHQGQGVHTAEVTSTQVVELEQLAAAKGAP